MSVKSRKNSTDEKEDVMNQSILSIMTTLSMKQQPGEAGECMGNG